MVLRSLDINLTQDAIKEYNREYSEQQFLKRWDKIVEDLNER